MPEATVSAGFCEGKADHRPTKCRNANRQGRTLRSWLSNIRGLAGFSLAELTEPTSLHLQQLIAGTDVIQSRNGTQPKSRWAYDNTEGISFEPRPQPTPIGTPAICLFRQFNQRPDWALARGLTSGLIHNDDGQGPDARLYRRHGRARGGTPNSFGAEIATEPLGCTQFDTIVVGAALRCRRRDRALSRFCGMPSDQRGELRLSVLRRSRSPKQAFSTVVVRQLIGFMPVTCKTAFRKSKWRRTGSSLPMARFGPRRE